MISAIRAARQLPGGERTDVDDAPAPARNILIPMMMTMIMQMRFYRSTDERTCQIVSLMI